MTSSNLKVLFCTIALIGSTSFAQGNSERLSSALRLQYGIDTVSHTIEVVSNQIDHPIGENELVSFKALSMKEPLGLFTVLAFVISGVDTVAQGHVRFRIDKFADVLISTDRLQTRHLLAAEDFAIQRVNVTNLFEKPVTDFSQVAGLRMKRSVSKGSVLTVAAVESTPEVELGREVAIVYQSGACRITASGTALQNGRLGDHIKIRNKTSGQVVLATVTNQSEVSVTP